LPKDKFVELEEFGVETQVVSLGNNPDYRSARINLARELDAQSDWIWTNQYDNLSNYKAHFETTGPEIWSQMEGHLDYIVVSVGTGGTICGVGHYLKQKNPTINVIAVEPKGSTIFGGKPGKYLNVGAGMHKPTGIIKEYGHVIDNYCQVDDQYSLEECIIFNNYESMSVGVTTGSVLFIASHLASHFPDKNVLAISPDGGEMYNDLFEEIIQLDQTHCRQITLVEYGHRKI